MLFQFVVACTRCSSKLREEKKNQFKYYFIILFEIQNTNTLFIETRTRVKQLNEFNAVKSVNVIQPMKRYYRQSSKHKLHTIFTKKNNNTNAVVANGIWWCDQLLAEIAAIARAPSAYSLQLLLQTRSLATHAFTLWLTTALLIQSRADRGLLYYF